MLTLTRLHPAARRKKRFQHDPSLEGVELVIFDEFQERSLQADLGLALTRLTVPSGSSVKLRYSPDGSPPVLAVRIQEIFGLADTPRVNEGRTPVLLHLLSPAYRSVQVTQDLKSFWANTYPEIRKELRGRYNKYPWPEDPWNAQPTRKAKPRSH